MNPIDDTVTISPLRRRHLDTVVDIERAAHPTPWSRRLFEGELGRTDRHYVVARVGDRVLGYAGLIVLAGDGHVATIATDASVRRRGLATALLLELVDEAIRRRVEALTLEVRVGNDAAQALYRRFGFVPAGVRRRYYGDGEDAIVMWANDLDDPLFQNRIEAIRTDLRVPVRRHGFEPAADAAHPAGGGHPAPSGHPAEGGHPAQSGHPASSDPHRPPSESDGPAVGRDDSSGRMER